MQFMQSLSVIMIKLYFVKKNLFNSVENQIIIIKKVK